MFAALTCLRIHLFARLCSLSHFSLPISLLGDDGSTDVGVIFAANVFVTKLQNDP